MNDQLTFKQANENDVALLDLISLKTEDDKESSDRKYEATKITEDITFEKLDRILKTNTAFVSYLLDDPIGYWIGLVHHNDSKAFVSNGIFVTKNQRGNKYSKDIVKHQLDWARTLGCKERITTVASSNKAMIRTLQFFGAIKKGVQHEIKLS